MSTYRYRLRFNAPVHFGSAGIGLEKSLERLSSDSLTSALINAFAVLGEAEEVVQALKGESPPFILSSLYPFGPSFKGSGTMFALPKPLSAPPVQDKGVLTVFAKDLKQVRYLELQDFVSWIGEKPLNKEEVNSLLERSHELARRWEPTEGRGWFAIALRPRVTLDRVYQNSSIWYCSEVHFHPDAGLYGLVRIENDAWSKRLSTAFSLLGDMGIGGERTYGMGAFNFSGLEMLDKQWSSALIGTSNKSVLLSSYYPSPSERSDLSSRLEAWNLSESRGYVVSGRNATTLKRKRVRMIMEGSVFRKPVRGSMVNVTPDASHDLGLEHNVYRCGLAFLWPGGGAH